MQLYGERKHTGGLRGKRSPPPPLFLHIDFTRLFPTLVSLLPPTSLEEELATATQAPGRVGSTRPRDQEPRCPRPSLAAKAVNAIQSRVSCCRVDSPADTSRRVPRPPEKTTSLLEGFLALFISLAFLLQSSFDSSKRQSFFKAQTSLPHPSKLPVQDQIQDAF